jgi:hypothetical protein
LKADGLQAAGTASARLLALIRDAQARILRALDAVVDGEQELAAPVLEDLLADIERALGGQMR